MRRVLGLCIALGLTACGSCFEDQLGERPYPCNPDAGEDPIDGGKRPDGGARQCWEGWRCGLERVCHSRAVAAAYLCGDDDALCEGGWECGPEGVCVAPIDDGFKSGAPAPAAGVEWVSPKLSTSQPDRVAASDEGVLVPGLYASGIAWTHGSRYELLSRIRVGPPTDRITGNYTTEHFVGALPAPADAIAGSAITVEQVLVLTDAGVGYMHSIFTPDAGAEKGISRYVAPPAWAGVRGTALRVVPTLSPYAAAFGPDSLTLLEFPAGGFPRFVDAGFAGFAAQSVPIEVAVPLPDGGRFMVPGQRLVDISAIDLRAGARQVLYASVDGQLWYAERHENAGRTVFVDFDPNLPGYATSPGGRPLFGTAVLFPAVGGTEAIVPGPQGYVIDGVPYRLGRLRTLGSRIAIEAMPVPTVDAGPMLLLGATELVGPPFYPIEAPFTQLLLPACEACPVGSTLVDFRPSGSGAALLEARCLRSDGGQLTSVMQSAVGGSGCISAEVTEHVGPFADSVVPSEGLVGHGGWAGHHGQLWYGESLLDTQPVLLDRPPRALLSAGGTDVAAVENRTFFYLVDAGFFATQGVPDDPFAPVASVIGKSDWAVTRDGYLGRRALGGFGNVGGSAVAFIGASVDISSVREPYGAQLAHTPDGGSVVVMTAFDALYSADVTAIDHDPMATPGQMEFRIVPVTRVPLRSLAVVDLPADAGIYTRGWVLARAELFEFVAESPEHWRTRRVAVPDGELVKVWADGDRGRLGYADGRVLSLPALKGLSGPVDGGGFEDFYQHGGHNWAIRATGLVRLQPAEDGGAPGGWVAGPDVGSDLGGARLYDALGSMYLITRTGLSYRIR